MASLLVGETAESNAADAMGRGESDNDRFGKLFRIKR
jgi:hypothetical protein